MHTARCIYADGLVIAQQNQCVGLYDYGRVEGPWYSPLCSYRDKKKIKGHSFDNASVPHFLLERGAGLQICSSKNDRNCCIWKGGSFTVLAAPDSTQTYKNNHYTLCVQRGRSLTLHRFKLSTTSFTNIFLGNTLMEFSRWIPPFKIFIIVGK